MTRPLTPVAIGLLILGQAIHGAPAPAAEIREGPRTDGATRVAAFAGARLRVPIGGRDASRARVALALAPTQRSEGSAGATRLRFGEGVELDLAGRERSGLRIAGYRFSPGAAPLDGKGRRLGVSTAGAAAIGAGVVLVSAALIALVIRGGEE